MEQQDRQDYYVKFDLKLLKQTDLDHFEILLLSYFEFVCNLRKGECWVSIENKAELFKVSRHKITRTQKKLEEKGYIVNNRGRIKMNNSNASKLNFDASKLNSLPQNQTLMPQNEATQCLKIEPSASKLNFDASKLNSDCLKMRHKNKEENIYNNIIKEKSNKKEKPSASELLDSFRRNEMVLDAVAMQLKLSKEQLHFLKDEFIVFKSSNWDNEKEHSLNDIQNHFRNWCRMYIRKNGMPKTEINIPYYQ